MPSIMQEKLSHNSSLVLLRNKSAGTNNGEQNVGNEEKASLAQIGIIPPKEVQRSTPKRNRDSKCISMISTKHYDSLICELRCPGCSKPMQAPIRLCISGHSVCDLCTKMLAKCPLCSKRFTETRSITLEAVSAKAEFYCSNAANGCLARLPLQVLNWHEKRCVYQKGDCFMGKVWDNCTWHGCEIDWIDHCISEHIERIFFKSEVTIDWQCTYEEKPKPICAYYIFQVFNETFNLYQIWDKPMRRVSWTIICASKDPKICKRFAYEIELYSKTDPYNLQIQRRACHSEKDEDVLEEGRCIGFDMGDVMRFMNAYRVSLIIII